MKRAKQLGSVVFDMNSLFIREEMSPSNIMADTVMSAAGSHIVYEADILTPYITLDSKQYGWIREQQAEELKSMWGQIGLVFVLTYDDDSTETVRMAHEKQLALTPIYEGSDKYTAVIPLAKA
ncbi:hypothetical protein [Sulfurovum sp.]|uniref:hypothetical protein n=1 Tax=Sulfurovum sp. TaxID=1969726 RepID=UPI00260D3467|nr:hypothetical protein [Sulfurovum sp.]